MTTSEKLVAVAENVPKVYEAGKDYTAEKLKPYIEDVSLKKLYEEGNFILGGMSRAVGDISDKQYTSFGGTDTTDTIKISGYVDLELELVSPEYQIIIDDVVVQERTEFEGVTAKVLFEYKGYISDSIKLAKLTIGTTHTFNRFLIRTDYAEGFEAGKGEGGGGVSPLDYATLPPSFQYADFTNCPNLIVKLPNLAVGFTSSVNASAMFNSTKNLQSVTLICNARNIPIQMTTAFYASRQLVTIDVSEFNTIFSNPTSMFGSCLSLKKIIGTLDFSKATAFSNTFGQCIELEEIRVKYNCIKATMDISATKVLSKDSISSIINGLSDETSGLKVSLSSTAVNNAFTNDE